MRCASSGVWCQRRLIAVQFPTERGEASAPRGNPAPGAPAAFAHRSLHAGGFANIAVTFWKGKEATTRGPSCWEPTLLRSRPPPGVKAARWDVSGEPRFQQLARQPA